MRNALILSYRANESGRTGKAFVQTLADIDRVTFGWGQSYSSLLIIVLFFIRWTEKLTLGSRHSGAGLLGRKRGSTTFSVAACSVFPC